MSDLPLHEEHMTTTLATLRDAVADVASWAWTGDTAGRDHMRTPFWCAAWGAPWVAATDGHRAALIRHPDAATLRRPDAPPLDAVIARDAVRLVELGRDDLEPLQHLPLGRCRAWTTITPDGAKLYMSREIGPARKRRIVRVINGAIVWPDLKSPQVIPIDVRYLLDAVEFVTCGYLPGVTVWRLDEVDNLYAPLAFTTGDAPSNAPRVGIVMPCAT